MNHPNYEAILKWYRGKALAAIQSEAIPLLRQSVDQEYWVPKASRRVKSLLRKTSRTATMPAVDQAKELESTKGGRIRDWEVLHGCFWSAIPQMRFDRGEGYVPGPLRDWCADFAPIAELCNELDQLRPKPVYVLANISRTVMDNVGKAMGLALESVRSPEVVWELVEMEIKGRKVKQWVGRIIWPDGTIHNASRYSGQSPAGNEQCHACGHAIRNPWNWVPLLADSLMVVDPDSPELARVPHSLWTGRDCAENLFGVKIQGEARFERGLKEG